MDGIVQSHLVVLWYVLPLDSRTGELLEVPCFVLTVIYKYTTISRLLSCDLAFPKALLQYKYF